MLCGAIPFHPIPSHSILYRPFPSPLASLETKYLCSGSEVLLFISSNHPPNPTFKPYLPTALFPPLSSLPLIFSHPFSSHILIFEPLSVERTTYQQHVKKKPETESLAQLGTARHSPAPHTLLLSSPFLYIPSSSSSSSSSSSV